jgi:sugar/nucleoside kinase (ribokinase family)
VKHYDIVYAGNYTKDTIVTPSEIRVVDGGAVNYAAHAAARLGVKTAVVTRLAQTDRGMIERLEAAGVDCYPVYTSTSTCLTLVYRTSNVDQRELSVQSTAGTIEPEQFDELETRAVVFGASLRGEVELGLIQHLRQRSGIRLAADVQGFVRVLRGRTLVYEPWEEMPAVLRNLDILKSDAVEAEYLTGEADIHRAARVFASLGAREIVLTHSAGVLIHAEGKDYEYPFYPGSVIGRSGRGDTCLGTYAALRLCLPPAEAGRWAAAVTSLKLEKMGPFDRSKAEVEAFLERHYAA